MHKGSPAFDSILSKNLRLWKVFITAEEYEANKESYEKPENVPNCQKLDPLDLISGHWGGELSRMHLHLIVQVPKVPVHAIPEHIGAYMSFHCRCANHHSLSLDLCFVLRPPISPWQLC
jgi:hypothetical protein